MKKAGEKKIKMAEINFLCVHKKVRQHRLAPVLIKEVTRRVNLRNIWQAVIKFNLRRRNVTNTYTRANLRSNLSVEAIEGFLR